MEDLLFSYADPTHSPVRRKVIRLIEVATGQRELKEMYLDNQRHPVPSESFWQAAVRRLRLATLGFLQYLTPSIQFLLALAVFGEAFAPALQVSFGCIWAALLLFSVEAIIDQRWQTPQPAPQRLPQETPPADRPRTPLTRSMS